MELLSDIRGIRFVFFSNRDVVRHRLVQDIIEAYDRSEERPSREHKTSNRDD
jgi:phosphate starvation-inducible PhoH-like protein